MSPEAPQALPSQPGAEESGQGYFDTLLRTSHVVAASLEPSDLFRGVCDSLRGLLHLTHFAVALVNEAAGELTFPFCYLPEGPCDLPPADLYRDRTLAALAVRSRSLLAPDFPPGVPPEGLVPGVDLPEAYLAVPLLSGARVMGALVLSTGDFAEALDPDVRRLLTLVAAQVSLAVEKAALYDALRRHARSLEERVVERTAELRAEKVRFESTVRSMREGLLLFDLERRVSFANERALELLKVPLDQVIGLPASALWLNAGAVPEDPARVQAEFLRAMTQPETYPEMEVRVRSEEQAGAGKAVQDLAGLSGRRDLCYLNLRFFPIRDHQGRPLGSGLMIQDITRDREMDRMKDELINVVSHELRTPISSVIGFAELLLSRDYPEPRRRQMVETIYKEAERLAGLIDHFLDLRRMESGRASLEFEMVSLREVVEDVAAAFVLQHPCHSLALEVPEDLPPVRADRERLSQALQNLLSNAFKYSPQGGEVRVRAWLEGPEVRVTVSDQGLGIPREALPHLFRKFYRVDTSDRRQIGGTGLGLAIVHQIVAAHGGRVWADSPGPGQGSTFGFSLPLAFAATDSGAGLRLPKGPYVLLFEQEAGQEALLREHLEPAGFPVVSATDPVTLLDLAGDRRPAGIVVDIPPSDPECAWSLVSTLRARFGDHLPLVVTGVVDEQDRAEALGVRAFLVKPFDPRRLLAILEERPVRRVLVVDDDELILRLLTVVLEGSGLKTETVMDGEEALRRVAADPPDLVLLDLMMPGMDGFEVLDHLRAHPATEGLPVVVLTARHLSATEREQLQRKGAFVLTKGEYSAVRLRAAVETALRERRPRSLEAVEVKHP